MKKHDFIAQCLFLLQFQFFMGNSFCFVFFIFIVPTVVSFSFRLNWKLIYKALSVNIQNNFCRNNYGIRYTNFAQLSLIILQTMGCNQRSKEEASKHETLYNETSGEGSLNLLH